MGNNPILYNDVFGDTLPAPPQVSKGIQSTYSLPFANKSSTVQNNKTENVANAPAEKSPTSSTNSENIGQTISYNVAKEIPLVNLPTGDKASLDLNSTYTTGNEGKIITNNITISDGTIETSKTILGVLKLGTDTKGGVQFGVGAVGFEGHIGLGTSGGLPEVKIGASRAINSYISQGPDLKVRPGLAVATAVAVSAVAPYIAVTAAFKSLFSW